jgi:hypothetical protein
MENRSIAIILVDKDNNVVETAVSPIENMHNVHCCNREDTHPEDKRQFHADGVLCHGIYAVAYLFKEREA